MTSLISHKIKVSVETFYQSDYSYPMSQHFMFAYRIIITNNSKDTVQLLRRHWFIVDALGQKREVEGEGVVGEQPVLQAGESYEYISGCDLKTDIGKMYGSYLMVNLFDGKLFQVEIPEFFMTAPLKMN
ncbi:MAG: Co2+/Mg2+ efflux protein ApaG [Saprospirales bacterium]|jgi:ApaG protein|nr:Co2+/Mg2+ efflux protein ApaG [Saprospirales bacterium]